MSPFPTSNRSFMFFESDALAAADDAAFALECHGLMPEQVTELSTRLKATIDEFWAELDR